MFQQMALALGCDRKASHHDTHAHGTTRTTKPVIKCEPRRQLGWCTNCHAMWNFQKKALQTADLSGGFRRAQVVTAWCCAWNTSCAKFLLEQRPNNLHLPEDRLTKHDINSEDVRDVRQKSWTYLGECMSTPQFWSPAGTRTANDREKKEDSKNISPTSPFKQLRFHSNPKSQRPRRSGGSAHGVQRSAPLCDRSASSRHRDSFKRALLAPAGRPSLPLTIKPTGQETFCAIKSSNYSGPRCESKN